MGLEIQGALAGPVAVLPLLSLTCPTDGRERRRYGRGPETMGVRLGRIALLLGEREQSDTTTLLEEQRPRVLWSDMDVHQKQKAIDLINESVNGPKKSR